VAGEILHRFGDHKSGNETYRGIVYRARPGATVVAPYDGEVVYTGPFRDYGNILLIKHQNGYISLIAGLGNISTSLNQRVIRGEPVATMSNDKDAQTYVELRDATAKPIDPGNWFANVGQSVTQNP
jgi:septal ring factor EnvC (AmiA/AmiB activator)